jgi:two-component system C4-dicarboxylate transport response regulator DctD
MARFESAVIEQALRQCGGRISEVLTLLDLPRKTFYDKVNRLGIDPGRFRSSKAE